MLVEVVRMVVMVAQPGIQALHHDFRLNAHIRSVDGAELRRRVAVPHFMRLLMVVSY